MRHKDRVIIDNRPKATIKWESSKAICLGFDNKPEKFTVWIPKKLINIKECKPVKFNNEQVSEYIIDLPKWFLNTTDMRLLLIPSN
jgi:hypothetical protein|tara:strand:- start:221 stop:478 length:258 start_codon:yes stop_codon:yes gene_type:complete